MVLPTIKISRDKCEETRNFWEGGPKVNFTYLLAMHVLVPTLKAQTPEVTSLYGYTLFNLSIRYYGCLRILENASTEAAK